MILPRTLIPLLPALTAAAQPCEPRFSAEFPTAGPPSSVQAQAVFDDGSGPALHIAGSQGVFKWTGTQWVSLNFGPVAGGLYTLAVFDEDGPGPQRPALFVGGEFTSAGGATAVNIARWDGATWSSLGEGLHDPDPGSWVHTLCVFDDGSGPALYAGGKFYYSGPALTALAAKWDGSQWHGLGTGFSGLYVLNSTVFDPDGPGPLHPRLYLGGTFGEADGVPARNIVAWDGAAFSPLDSGAGAGFDGVYALVPWDNGDGQKLYVAGRFDQAGGVPAPNIARWTGSQWQAVPGSAAAGLDREAGALAVLDRDGAGPEPASLIVGGGFDHAAGAPAAHIVRITGTTWSPLGSGVDAPVSTLVTLPDPAGDTLAAGGGFITAGGLPVSGIARWHADQWSTFGPQRNSIVGNPAAAAVLDTGSGPALYVGTISAAGPLSGSGAARWDGAAWSRLPYVPFYALSEFCAFAVYDDGSGPAPFAAGYSWYEGRTYAFLVKWTGSGWSDVSASISYTPDTAIRALLVLDDDGPGPARPALYVGGRFCLNSSDCPNLARYDGSTWSTPAGGITPAPDGGVYALDSLDDPAGPVLCIGGSFTAAGGQPASNFARLRAGVWLPSPGTPDPIRTLAHFSDASGTFLYAATGQHIARLESSWTAVGAPFDGTPSALAVFDPDGAGPNPASLYAAGDLPSLHNLARWTAGAWTTVAGGTDGPITALAASPAASGVPPLLFAVGDFQTAGGLPSGGVARLVPCTACYANCDNSTAAPILNVNDFICFQRRFVAADPYANCDGSTTAPVLNVNDFICFQQRFAAGCP